MLRSSEKEILSLAAAELEARFDKQLHALVKGAAAQAAACREAGSSWPSMLMRRENVLQQQAERIGAEIAEVSPGAVEIRLPYRAELAQQHGFFHGGIVGTVADNACGYASFSLAAADASVLTVEYKLNLMAPAVGRKLIARARVLRSGRMLSVAQCDVFGDRDGRPVFCAASQSTLIEVGEA